MTWIAEFLPTLSITFPKSVRVENSRLAILYWVLCAAVISFVGYTSYQAEVYLVRFIPEGHFSFWISDWKVGDDAAKAINQQEADAKHCKALDDYTFCDSADCSGWSAQELQCQDLCTDGKLSDCLEMPERYVKESDSLFVPTFFHEMESLRKVDENGAVAEKVTSEKWRIIKGVTEMGIGFDHEYSVQTPQNGEYEKGSSILKESRLLTVLHDDSKNELARWQPGESISISLMELLHGAGVDLDTIMPELGQNFLQGAKHPQGVLTRIAGLKLWIHVQYYNPLAHSVDWDGPVAIIQVRTTGAAMWVSRPKVQVLDANGSQRLRYYNGIEVQLTAGGSFAWLSTDAFVGILTSMLVFMGLAKNFVYFFTLRCLGLISEVYKGFLYQQCSLSKECCALAARLCSHTSTFVELKDLEAGISETRILRRFKRIFKPFEDELDEGEVQRLADFVFKGINKHQKVDRNAKSSVISVDGFSWACSHGEPLKLRTLIHMFDAHRHKNLLERIFAGPDLKKLFKSDRAMRSNSSMSEVDLASAATPISPQIEPVAEPASEHLPEEPLAESRRDDHVVQTEESHDGKAYGTGGTGGCVDSMSTSRFIDNDVRHEIKAIQMKLEERAQTLEASQKHLKEEMDQLRSMYLGTKEPIQEITIHEKGKGKKKTPRSTKEKETPKKEKERDLKHVVQEDSNLAKPNSKVATSCSEASTGPVVVTVDDRPSVVTVDAKTKMEGSLHDANGSSDKLETTKDSRSAHKKDPPVKDKSSMCCG